MEMINYTYYYRTIKYGIVYIYYRLKACCYDKTRI